MGFLKQAYQNGLPFPPPRDLPNSGIEPALQVGSLLSEPPDLRFIITLPSVSLTHSVYLFNLPLQFCSEDTKGVFPPKYPLSRPSNPLDINMIYSPCIESCYSKMPWKLAPMRKISVSLIATELNWILTWFSWVYYAYYAYTSQLEDTGFIL